MSSNPSHSLYIIILKFVFNFINACLHGLESSVVWSSLVDQTTPSAALDVLHHQHAEGVMQYIQRYGGSGLVHETMVRSCSA